MFYASSNLKKQHISNLISVYKRFGKNIVSIQNILKTINRNERSKMCTWYKKKKGILSKFVMLETNVIDV